MWSNGLPSSVSDLFVGDVFSVRDAEEFSEASQLHGLYSKTHRRTGIWT